MSKFFTITRGTRGQACPVLHRDGVKTKEKVLFELKERRELKTVDEAMGLEPARLRK